MTDLWILRSSGTPTFLQNGIAETKKLLGFFDSSNSVNMLHYLVLKI